MFVSSFEEATLFRKSYAKTTKRAALGLEVIPFHAWLNEQWDLWGDSRKLISSLERTILVLKILREHAGIVFSEDTLALLSRYINEVLGSVAFETALDSLDLYEGVVREILEIGALYKEALCSYGFIESGEAFALLPVASFSQQFVLPESFVPPFFLQEFIASHEEMIFSEGKGTYSASGVAIEPAPDNMAVEFLFSSGVTSQDALLAQRIDCWLAHEASQSQREKPSTVLILSAHPLERFTSFLSYFQSAGINAAVCGSCSFNQTFFGKSYVALHAFLTERSLSALSDYLKSPYSGVTKFDAYQIDALLRSEKCFDEEEIFEVLRKKAPHFSYAEELFENIDASLVLDYFKDVARKLFSYDEVVLQEELEAISVLRSLYETARTFKTPVESVLNFASSLKIKSTKVINQNQPIQVLFGAHHDVHTIPRHSFTTVALCDLDDRFFAQSDVFAAFSSIDEAIGISFVDSFLQEQRIMMNRAQACASERLACEEVLASLSGEETYPSFFFDEFLSFYKIDESKKVFSIDTSRCSVYQRGEEHLIDNAMIQSSVNGFDSSECIPCASESQQDLSVSRVTQGILSEKAKPNLILSRWSNEACKFIKSVSPSDIEAYVTCPYRWFIERRINPQKLDFERGFLEQGIFVHEVFADLYRVMNDTFGLARITEENVLQVVEIFNKVFDEKLQQQTEDDSAHYLLQSELDVLEGECLKETLLASLKRQAKLLPSYIPFCHEKALMLSDKTTYAGMPLVGRVDRIDISSDGKRFVVIDYKGSLLGHEAGFNPDKDQFELPQKIQALIYAQVLRKYFPDKVCSGALYLSYRAKEDKGSIAGSYNESVLDLDDFAKERSKVFMNFDAYLDQVEDALIPYLARMLAGDIEPNPSRASACKHCPVANCNRRCE